MSFEITQGKINKAKKVVIYAIEGIGKTWFAAQFPDPIFIDTEDSTTELDVKRLPKPTSWQMLFDEVKFIIQNRPCKTLVVDTADWAESLCIQAVCGRYGKGGVEEFGYGQGYTYVAEEWGRFLNLLQDVIDVANINVVLTAHAIIRKFEQPDEFGSYDRWELKLGKKTTGQTAPITKEWADMVLFGNYKTISVAADDQGKKHKAQGGVRTLFTQHHPCWDAKNRYGLPSEIPPNREGWLDYSKIAFIFENQDRQAVVTPAQTSTSPVNVQPEKPMQQTINTLQQNSAPEQIQNIPQNSVVANPKIHKGLMDLMMNNHVTEDEIKQAVHTRGFFPLEVKVEEYPLDFIEAVLIAAWNDVFKVVNENRNLEF